MSDVVEAMARGIHNANPGLHEPWANIVAAEALGNRLAERTAALRRAEARAAIRACHAAGGLVVGKMPEDERIDGARDSAAQMLRAEGHNAALAAIRAAAVEVEP